MNDYDKLTGLLKQFNVSYKVTVDQYTKEYRVYVGETYSVLWDEDVVEEHRGDENKVKAYYGFFSCYCFDSDKNFKSIGIFE